MKILFATTNPAKVSSFRKRLEESGVELLTLQDIDISLNINESGSNAIENALIKAKSYYEVTGITTIGMDNNLYIEGIPENRQPGTFVRRVNGRELNDEEMLKYYTALVKEYGGRLTAKWVYGMVIYNGEKAEQYSWSMNNFYLIDKIYPIINKGYPLDSITIIPKYNKYLVELTDEERRQDDDYIEHDKAVEFILGALR